MTEQEKFYKNLNEGLGAFSIGCFIFVFFLIAWAFISFLMRWLFAVRDTGFFGLYALYVTLAIFIIGGIGWKWLNKK